MKGSVEHAHPLLLFLFRRKLGLWSPPLRVEQLCKINESEAGVSTPASKVEDDSGFHRSEKRIARACSSIIHEVGLIDTTVGGLGSGFTDDPGPELGILRVWVGGIGAVPLNHVHLSNDIMEGDDF